MNRVKPRGLAALTALCVLVVILVGTGCGAAAPSGSSTIGASSSPNHASTGHAEQDSGLVACAYPLATQDVSAADYAKIRPEFADSRWPDLRKAGTAYVDLAVLLLHARGGTDGYKTVWFYQRLSLACARHGWK